jgi:hypothetical protein
VRYAGLDPAHKRRGLEMIVCLGDAQQ